MKQISFNNKLSKCR